MRPYHKEFMFNSSLSKSIYKANSWYMAQEFKFHLSSEHIIDGVEFDLEFQMYFISKDPEAGHNYGVISVLFNRTNYTDSTETNKSITVID